MQDKKKYNINFHFKKKHNIFLSDFVSRII
jgi:hypothetical protein